MSGERSTKKVVSVNIQAKKKTLPTRGAKKAKPYHHGDLRAAVLEKADEMLEKQGIENLSLRDVAESLGVSHAAPYRHFPRKLDLLFALAERGFEDLALAMEDAFSGAKNPEGRFRMSGVSYVRLAVAHPVRTHLMFSRTLVCDDVPESLQIAGKRAFDGLVKIIEDGQVRGDFTKEGDAMFLAVSAWSLVHGLAALISCGQLADAAKSGDPFIAEILRHLYVGLRSQTERI